MLPGEGRVNYNQADQIGALQVPATDITVMVIDVRNNTSVALINPKEI